MTEKRERLKLSEIVADWDAAGEKLDALMQNDPRLKMKLDVIERQDQALLEREEEARRDKKERKEKIKRYLERKRRSR